MRSDCLAAFQQPSAVQEDKFFCCSSSRKGSAGLRKIRGKATLQTQPEARVPTQGLPGARGQQGCMDAAPAQRCEDREHMQLQEQNSAVQVWQETWKAKQALTEQNCKNAL